jgi:sugar O-acyltransferase (sialic acid O-acetyltransferase NeuD family)
MFDIKAYQLKYASIMDSTAKIVLIGASGQGKVVLDILRLQDAFSDYVFLDDDSNLQGKSVLGVQVRGTTKDLATWKSNGFRNAFIALGNNQVRERFQTQLSELGFQFATAIHPRATVARDVTIGEGTCVMAGAIINPGTSIGKGCIINTGSTVDHDNHLLDYAQIMPGVHLAGTVNVGRRAALGTGAIVLPNLSICDDAVIGAGAVVTKDVTTTVPYIGVPARPMTVAQPNG